LRRISILLSIDYFLYQEEAAEGSLEFGPYESLFLCHFEG
jgi:hypothetical protein